MIFLSLPSFVRSLSLKRKRKRKEKKNYTGSEIHSPHQLRKRSHFGTEYRKAPPPRKGKEKLMGIRRVSGLA
jgi:hypothetical protein